jgi:leucyl-tRNA synthetase
MTQNNPDNIIKETYSPQTIETQAQQYWNTNQSFATPTNQDTNPKNKFYCLSMLPYPSGNLHMGHVRNYSIGDAISRYQKLLGKTVMQPMGWDSFGLPAENAALKHKVPPKDWTIKNISHMKDQFKSLGLGYDWNREISTCDPTYYKWEQLFFTELFNKGLIYRKESEVNWDPIDQTVLANEQVIDGRGWRSGALIEKKKIPQWFIKITDYAEQLLSDLDQLENWPDQVKLMQKNWIGKSTGLEIDFNITSDSRKIKVFTTRADTICGATYLCISPNHPISLDLAKTNSNIQNFIHACNQASTQEADLETQEKKGLFTELYAINPITKIQMPIWIANFVLISYGTGAVMSVPAHDQRDYEFAIKYNLPIQVVINQNQNQNQNHNTTNILNQNCAYTGTGNLINSGIYNNLSSNTAKQKISEDLIKQNIAKLQTNYR